MKFKSEKGQAMVEFALILPILLAIIGGIIDFGWVYHQQVLANNYSRESARYVSINYNTVASVKSDPALAAKNEFYDKLPNYVKNAMNSDGNPVNNFVVSVSGGMVSLTLEWNTTTFMPFYSKFLNNITIDATTVMKLET